MAELVSFQDAEGRIHWTAAGSRAHRDHLRAEAAQKKEDAAAAAELPAAEAPAAGVVVLDRGGKTRKAE